MDHVEYKVKMLVTFLRPGSSEPLSLQQRRFSQFQLLPKVCKLLNIVILWLEGWMFY